MSKDIIKPFTYNGYGCPNTEMWTRRAAFEEAHPDLNVFMKKDAPHYANAETRKAYTIWEDANPYQPA